MSRPLERGIARYLAAKNPRLTIKETGDLRVIGKASTLQRQLADAVNQNTLGQVPMQDVFENEPGYTKGLSFK